MQMKKTWLPLAFLGFSLIPLTGCAPLVVTGVGATTILMAEDRRTPGTAVDDEGIEFKLSEKISNYFSNSIHVNITAFNRMVLLTGEAPNAETKKAITSMAYGLKNVKHVVNEMRIAPNSSLATRSHDSLLTTKVKTRMFDAKSFKANHIKVVTENGIVYLMGLVTRKEGNDAAYWASTTIGVDQVVKVFEYID